MFAARRPNRDHCRKMNFSALGLSPSLIAILSGRNITAPLEIQTLVIPRLLAGENVLFCAPTGTGKTFAYLLPLFQRLFCDPDPAAGNGASNEAAGDVSAKGAGTATNKVRLLVCAPTHELCSQIKGEVDFLLKANPTPSAPRPAAPRASLIIGASGMERQIDTLKKEKPQIVVGNPGRLLQLARMGRLRLDAVQALVLDEGDRLVSDEMLEDTTELLRFCSARERQTAACSATVSAKYRERLLPLLGSTAAVIEAKEKITGIEHWAFFSEDRKKISCLRSLLAAAKPKKALVFTARGGDAGNILSQLQFHHFAAGGIWGDMDKKARKAAMDGFRKGSLSVLVASDLACRGLDIPDLSHVIALDVPSDPELYLHRSGRTGRTGKRGIMASIGNEEEMYRLQKIEKKLGIIVYPKELYGGRVLAAGSDS